MRRRLRKKLRIGEFREDGFAVAASLAAGQSTAKCDQVLDDFLDFLSHHGLQFGGQCGPTWDGIVERTRRGSALERHRAIVGDWLDTHPQVASFQIGPLFDAWH